MKVLQDNTVSNFKTCLLKEINNEVNIYDYFNRDYVWVFDQGDGMEDITITIHDGDLNINDMSELPNDIEFLLVKGNFTVKDKLKVLEFGAHYPNGFIPAMGALIVTGNLVCSELHLSSGDVAVLQNLSAEKFIYSNAPLYEQGSLHVRGEVKTPFIFRKDEYNPSFYFDKNNDILSNDCITKYNDVSDINERAFIVKEDKSKQLYTADSYYRYLEKRKQEHLNG